jgi:alpha-glucosidase (family GH31 glycosyl hydrolase)
LYKTTSQSFVEAHANDHELVFEGFVWGLVQRAAYSLRFHVSEESNQLQIDLVLTTLKGKINRSFLNYWADKSESFHGFGVQYSNWNLKGRRVPIVVAEQGVGRGAQPITAILNSFAKGSGGDDLTSYAPKAMYITNQKRAVLFENTELMYFDLRREGRVAIELWGQHMKGRIISGENLLNLISEISLITGRMKPLPDWTQGGSVIGLEGGSEEVEQKLALLQNASFPISAIWLQDWSGLRRVFEGDRLVWNWNIDDSYYSNWNKTLARLSQSNIRILSYVNPFFSINPDSFNHSTRKNLVNEGSRLGYYVKTKSGSNYVISSGTIDFYLLDVTNPSARTWMKSILKKNMIQDTGVSGWMADFGEHLPFDAVLHNGVPAAEFHNQYPLEWAKINEEAISEYNTERKSTSNGSDAGSSADELVYFMRSASMQSPAHTSLFWLGDQCVSWDKFDGIKSVVTAAITGGLAGHSLTHSDIGGYTMVS